MAKALYLEVIEDLPQLKKELKTSSNKIRPRIMMLVIMKKSKAMLTKYELAEKVGVSHTSITIWRKTYSTGGLSSLLTHNQGGKRREVITATVHKAIEKRITSSDNGFSSYKTLQEWVDEHYIPGIKYITLLKYVQEKFGAKLKVARKSHINKDEQAIEAFKKNPSSVRKTH